MVVSEIIGCVWEYDGGFNNRIMGTGNTAVFYKNRSLKGSLYAPAANQMNVNALGTDGQKYKKKFFIPIILIRIREK